MKFLQLKAWFRRTKANWMRTIVSLIICCLCWVAAAWAATEAYKQAQKIDAMGKLYGEPAYRITRQSLTQQDGRRKAQSLPPAVVSYLLSRYKSYVLQTSSTLTLRKSDQAASLTVSPIFVSTFETLRVHRSAFPPCVLVGLPIEWNVGTKFLRVGNDWRCIVQPAATHTQLFSDEKVGPSIVLPAEAFFDFFGRQVTEQITSVWVSSASQPLVSDLQQDRFATPLKDLQIKRIGEQRESELRILRQGTQTWAWAGVAFGTAALMILLLSGLRSVAYEVRLRSLVGNSLCFVFRWLLVDSGLQTISGVVVSGLAITFAACLLGDFGRHLLPVYCALITAGLLCSIAFTATVIWKCFR
jgi:hypothetical protein